LQDIDQQVLDTKYAVNFGQLLNIIHDLKSQVIKSWGCKVDTIFLAMDYYKSSWVLMAEKHKMQFFFGYSWSKQEDGCKQAKIWGEHILIDQKLFHEQFKTCNKG
jgi:hypothetical protein